MAGMWIFPLMFMLLIVCVAFMLIWRGGGCMPWRGPGRKHGGAGEGDSAIDILNKRYARGEITKDEYEQMKSDILG
jgi:putative membrane protein